MTAAYLQGVEDTAYATARAGAEGGAVMFLYTMGHGSRRRVMHIATYDRRGELTGQAFCGRTGNATINVPLGLKVCRECLRERERGAK